MAAEQLLIGVERWWRWPGEYRRRAQFGNQHLWRIGLSNGNDGTTPWAAQARGKVVRGYEFVGDIYAWAPGIGQSRGRLRTPATLFALDGVLVERAMATVSEDTDYLFRLRHEDNSQPIGLFPQNTAYGNVQSDAWAGLRMYQAVTAAPGQQDPNDLSRDLHPVSLMLSLSRVLVSPKPAWTITAPPAGISVSDVFPLHVRVAYPDDEPVRGLEIVLIASSQTGVALDKEDGTLPLAYTAQQTDADGRATFWVFAQHAGAGALQIGLMQPEYAHLYAPLFYKQIPLTVAGLPTPNQCYEVPEVPEVPAIPSHIEVSPDFGWNAGANSVDTHPGDVFVQFTQRRAIGAVIGLTTTRDGVGTLERLTHAFYFYTDAGGAMRYRVMEAGAAVTPAQPYSASDLWRIERAGTNVRYLRNGTLVYTSRVPSSGEVSVGCSLYSAGDAVPVGA